MHNHEHNHNPPHLGPDDNDPDGSGQAALAELLDLDGDVLHSYWSDATLSVRRAASGPGNRIVDLGAGTGTGTIALAQLFGDAEVIAVDSSAEMLLRIRAKALDLGLADRIRTVEADLNEGLTLVRPKLEPIDVTWASMALHHLVDPDRVLGDIFAATRPGGLVAVAEFNEPLRFLPPDIGFGRVGLEDRILAVLTKEHAEALPELGSDWSSRLQKAGFALVSEQDFIIELTPPQSPGLARYAHHWLARLRSGIADQLGRDDLDTLDTLVDGDGPESLLRRGDLLLRGTRTVTIARRP